ncbi:MAG: formylglycine-generating enzyme family protein [Myxococcota bacterium]
MQLDTYYQDTLRDGGKAPVVVNLPAGSFVMGSEHEVALDSSAPEHTVTFARPFAIMVTEVTQAHFARFVQATDYRTEVERTELDCYPWNFKQRDPQYSWRIMPFKQNLRWPVVCVTWNDAEAYAQWLSDQTGHTYRLPSEAEWEYAARAGTRSLFSFGNSQAGLCVHANIADAETEFSWKIPCNDGVGFGTAEVASYAPNAWGLFDTTGNVSEYTQDCWHDNYGKAPTDGSAWRTVTKRFLFGADGDCNTRPTRGGSWIASAERATVARRTKTELDARGDTGFRLVREIPAEGAGASSGTQ